MMKTKPLDINASNTTAHVIDIDCNSLNGNVIDITAAGMTDGANSYKL